MTQTGKTWSVARGIGLRILLDATDISIPIISATYSQAQRLRSDLADVILACPALSKSLQMKPEGLERLRKEVSKERMTFKDGKEVVILSGHGKAKGIMGAGGALVIVDEAALIKDETYQKRIRRLGASRPDFQLVELSNPWTKECEFHNSFTSERYYTIQVDWRTAVEQSRQVGDETYELTEAFIEEERERLDPRTFTVLYESAFPDSAENALIRWDWIQEAVGTDAVPEGASEWGLDVAEKGSDKTVLTHGYVAEDALSVDEGDIHVWGSAETMATANMVAAIVPEEETVKGDAIGIGAGVCSRLEEKGFEVVRFKGSRNPEYATSDNDDEAEAYNRKAEAYWRLRRLFEEGANDELDVHCAIPEDKDLIADLHRARYDISKGDIRVSFENEDTDSPDRADSLCILAARKPKRKSIGSWS